MFDNNTDEKIKELVELSLLYDFYGELLKDHSKDIFEDYVLNDYSLGEISEKMNISRQGVYDIVKRCSKKLRDFEDKLHLLEKHNRIQKLTSKLISELSTLAESESDTNKKESLNNLINIAKDLL